MHHQTSAILISLKIRAFRALFLGAALLAGGIPDAFAQTQGICGRTGEVQKVILDKIAGVSNCANVTDAHLAAITGTLSLNGTTTLAGARGVRFRAGDLARLTGLTGLDITNTEFLDTSLDGIFADLGNLTNLNLNNSSLSALPTGVFDNLTKLQDLSFSSNDLSELPAGVFDNLTKLQVLSFSDNALSELPAGVFDKNTNLNKLTMSRNPLSRLPVGVFDKLVNLHQLFFSGTELTELPDSAFRNLVNLRDLSFGSNPGIAALPDDVFVRGNGMEEVPDLNVLIVPSGFLRFEPHFVRLDAEADAPGPATMAIAFPFGSPIKLTYTLPQSTDPFEHLVRGTPSTFTVIVPAGTTMSAPFTFSRNSGETEKSILFVNDPEPKLPTTTSDFRIDYTDVRLAQVPDIKLFPILGKPRNLRFGAADRQLVGFWDEALPSGDDITGYSVRWKLESATTFEAGNAATLSGAATTTYTITGLTNGSEYDVEVAARTANGDGDFVAVQGTPATVTLNVLGGATAGARDGIVIARYFLGVRGPSLLAGQADASADFVAIGARIQAGMSSGELNIDGTDVDTTDGLLIARYLIGVRGDALTDGLTTTSDAATIAAEIEKLMPQ